MKLLHNRLEHGSSLVDNLLSQHLGTFFLQPQALQLLLTSLPAKSGKQRLLYQSLSHLLRPGAALFIWCLPLTAKASLQSKGMICKNLGQLEQNRIQPHSEAQG